MLSSNFSPERPVSPISSASSAEVTAGHDASTINRTLDLSLMYDDGALMDFDSKHWIRVSRLDPNTTSKTLRHMFYPYGGDEAFVVWDNAVVGFVGFDNHFMAELAVEKMDAFIPCRHAQALCVCRASMDEVVAARNSVSCGQASITSLLYSDCPVRCIIQVIEAHRQPSYCAMEFVEEVKRSSCSLFSRISETLVQLKAQSPVYEEFREALVRSLLQSIVDEEQTDTKANCGALLGELFASGFLPGDPFQLASRILQRGVRSVAQVDNICAIAHACASLPLPMSKASFWALVGQMSLQAADPFKAALRAHVRRFHHSTEVFSPTPASNASATKIDKPMASFPDLKMRTVYISHLPASLPQRTFMEMLNSCGSVNKVRVCRGKGYATLFAFVEMADSEGVVAALRLGKSNIFGHNIRLQMARNPIQDSQPEDAVINADGSVACDCLFGRRGGLLGDVASDKGY
uniref:Putative RNA-binding protein n=1 Tax=Trypanosoma congolense (strain IL3000) TaxID=1068625 RepID=G0UZ86_TRYCI|nr:putative RNA-binding protein [Trypanosoma congolense IL3000]